MEIGIDIEEVDRIEKAHKKWGNRFLNRLFSKAEIDYCFRKSNPYQSLTGRFCAKEAVFKAIDETVNFRDIETLNNKNGKPYVCINGKKRENIKISISHTKRYATAVVINISQ